MTTDEAWLNDLASSYTEQPVHSSGKRIGLQWAPWMGDWFTSWSPRNGNNNAEGYWDHWIDLALHILADPLTAIVRPDVHNPELATKIREFYDEANRPLTVEELRARFDQGRDGNVHVEGSAHGDSHA